MKNFLLELALIDKQASEAVYKNYLTDSHELTRLEFKWNGKPIHQMTHQHLLNTISMLKSNSKNGELANIISLLTQELEYRDSTVE